MPLLCWKKYQPYASRAVEIGAYLSSITSLKFDEILYTSPLAAGFSPVLYTGDLSRSHASGSLGMDLFRPDTRAENDVFSAAVACA